MRHMIAIAALASALASQGAPAWAGSAPDAPVITKGQELFDDFGGKQGLTLLMDDFMINLLSNPRTKPFFENADQDHIKAMLVEQFCQILNGPCAYSGRDMKSAHEGMAVKTEDFYALVEELQKSMTKFKVPFRAQNKLLAALAPQHRDIITQ